MAPIVTDAIVLHAFDYLETSRIVRLLTREAGVQSVIAKGARRSRARYGSAVDLFAEGEAELYLKPGRDLQTLAAFDVRRARTTLALDMDRFLAASALAELVLKVGRDDANPLLYEAVLHAFDSLGAAAGGAVAAPALAGAWRIVAASGFAPALDLCASCHTPLDRAATVAFSHPAGGALCDRCARFALSARRLPSEARDVLRSWMTDEMDEAAPVTPILSTIDARAHLRLVREFLGEHVTDDRPLRAWSAWEASFTGPPSAQAGSQK
jgi:DNA repair protein RecO (recombination protein O)